MKEFIISENDEGRRLDKFVAHILVKAGSSFIYKMLRKKNIVLNDGKASGNELLCSGDIIKIYLSDETFEKFAATAKQENDISDCVRLMPPVIYEDDDIMIVNKPAGMLSQKSASKDISLNEICLAYTRKQNRALDTKAQFTPSICNRLDRNTSGLVTFAKTYRAARILSEAFSQRSLGKYYKCIAVGVIKEDMVLNGTLVKDKSSNKVTVGLEDDPGAHIETIVHPIRNNGHLTLADIRLLTGKTHQIRAHLASEGYPLLGDNKYGNADINRKYSRKYGITCQMLVCTTLEFPEDLALDAVAGRRFEIDVPDSFKKVM